MELLTPFYQNPDEGKPLWEVCRLERRTEKALQKANPYQIIIAREIRNWFNSSKMIAFFHKNPIGADEDFDFKVNLKKVNMYGKSYGKMLIKLAVTDTVYEPVISLFNSPVMIAFSPDVNVKELVKAAKKTPEVILLAGIVDGKLLSRNEFLEYGNMDLTSARVGLVSVLQSAGGNNLHRQLNHHQSTLVSRLQQIGTSDSNCDKND